MSFTLIYAPEAPYPRIVADTGHLADVIRPVPTFHVQGGDAALNVCCITPGNLERKPAPTGREDLKMSVCRRCGRRHFTALQEAGRLVTGA